MNCIWRSESVIRAKDRGTLNDGIGYVDQNQAGCAKKGIVDCEQLVVVLSNRMNTAFQAGEPRGQQPGAQIALNPQ